MKVLLSLLTLSTRQFDGNDNLLRFCDYTICLQLFYLQFYLVYYLLNVTTEMVDCTRVNGAGFILNSLTTR